MPQGVREGGLWTLHTLGQSPWLDFISRDMLASGELQRLILEDGITGVTSNPSIFEKAINSSSAYDGEIEKLARDGKTAEEIFEVLTAKDIEEAADLLQDIYNSSRGTDGFVSIEVSPHLAHDVKTTIDSATRIFERLGRKNVLIKVPATTAGVAAIEELLVKGININATLIFSMGHYESIAQVYFKALEKRKEQGLSLDSVHSVASVFVSRIDTVVDIILDTTAVSEADPARAAGLKNLRGTAAVANSCVIYHRFVELFSGAGFRALKSSGAQLQRIVWGSTSTKDPSYSDIKYVVELIGRDTVNTIPLQTITAFKDHGTARDTLASTLEQARDVQKRLQSSGINMDDLCQQIQDDGVKAFADSYDILIASIEKKRRGFLKS